MVNCPFCGQIPSDGEYNILLHMETHHPEGDGPPEIVPGTSRKSVVTLPQGNEYSGHPLQQVIGSVAEASSPSHKSTSTFEYATSSANKFTASKHPQSHSHIVQAWRDIFSGHKSHSTKDSRRVKHKSKVGPRSPNSTRLRHSSECVPASEATPSRLGKSELGRHVDERKMPEWLVMLLHKDGAHDSEGIIPVLAQLLEQSPSTHYAYLCSPHVHHVSKLKGEGSFCGYRNIQMLTSYIISSRSTGSELFGPTFPTIFEIQDLIENAWDCGFNPQGRVETGGIRGTRKYIGTPEAQAMFSSLQIPCPVQAFKDRDSKAARTELLRAIESYFQQGSTKKALKIDVTTLPPIYFQHRGHSMTIVGFEKNKKGAANLLVLDPAYHDSTVVRSFIGKEFRHPDSRVHGVLEPYRRGTKYLRRYNEFEILCLTDTAPPL